MKRKRLCWAAVWSGRLVRLSYSILILYIDILHIRCDFPSSFIILWLAATVRCLLWCKFNRASSILWPVSFEEMGRGLDRPRQRICSGIHHRCHTFITETVLAPLPCQKKKKKKGESCLPPHHMENCPNFFCFISNATLFKSNLLLRIPHANWALVWRRKLCDFLISRWALSDKFLSLTYFFFSSVFLFPPASIFYPIDWLAYIKPLSSWQNFIWIFSTFPVSFNQQLSATSTWDALGARQS